MGSKVSLVSLSANNDDLVASVAKAFELIDFNPVKRVRQVIIKPNMNYYWEPSTGATTDPRVVGAVIDHLREKYGKDIAIRVAEADATAMRTKHVFRVLGYDKLAEAKGIELFNLSTDVLKKERVNVNGQEIELEVPQSLVNADLFVNVPKLKIMRVTKITCAMKNLFGAIGTPKKFAFHKNLEETIVAINKILRPHVTLVDGLVALGRHPVKMGLLMAGVDGFSIDCVAARIAGYNPRSVKFLKIAEREKLGTPDGILITGEDLNQFIQKFPKEGFPPQKLIWSIMFKMLHIYIGISGDVLPPFLEEN